MIRITIEMVPKGFEDHKYTMGTIEITNTGTARSPRARGHYRSEVQWDAELSKINHTPRGRQAKWRTASVLVENFPRSQLTVYDLLYRVLREVVGSRNDHDRIERRRGPARAPHPGNKTP